MRRKTELPPSPLPQRSGIDPVRLRLPADGPWSTVRGYLLDHFPERLGEQVDVMLREGRFVGVDGPIAPAAAFRPHAYVWFHRDLPDEVPVPFGIDVLYRDERLLVVDKPHFLATMPRGRHVTETALARLRRDLELPELSPAHRLDRLTAGLAMFVITPEHRGAYQMLFHDRLVRKEYEAIAPYRPELALPRTVRSRIVKERGVIAAQEVAGEPNSESLVELIEHRGGLGRYRLVPHTGRTHQLRLHMSSLGIPLLGDPVYPVVLAETPLDDFGSPLQLLARRLEFTDPVTGEERSFRSRRTLGAWIS
ncbi:tRNA pseudouridine32 synthase/23S rRNA pseudouridine746 synthase [Kitasatospora sp. MAP12-15]|uniref:RluA family pseudouridine synthase n=1 Tax=unclassified Kitasatospora TaxID=2633591 RepID=UPI002474255E|nr:RluA family pseudouridine synthase [Kitasatospora sp. MAP12-44]MDH6108913.1 tRNA pseudouridine32 synthase/23S rRNA pseudouridine746 synthase [Kitasatospora sp. MAP12-44]